MNSESKMDELRFVSALLADFSLSGVIHIDVGFHHTDQKLLEFSYLFSYTSRSAFSALQALGLPFCS